MRTHGRIHLKIFSFSQRKIVWNRAIVEGVSNSDSTILQIPKILKILLQTIPANLGSVFK